MDKDDLAMLDDIFASGEPVLHPGIDTISSLKITISMLQQKVEEQSAQIENLKQDLLFKTIQSNLDTLLRPDPSREYDPHFPNFTESNSYWFHQPGHHLFLPHPN